MTVEKKIIHDLKARLSRRDILLGAAATAFMAKSAWNPAAANEYSAGGRGGSPGFVYVTSPFGAVGDLNGIVTYSWDPATGALDFVTFTPAPNGTTFIEINHALKVLYVSNESGPGMGGATAYKMNPDGTLSFLNFLLAPPTNPLDPLDPPSGTLAGPSYVALDTSKKYLLTASWQGHYTTAISLNSDGSLKAITDVVYYNGSLGPTATQQLGAHAHMIRPDPTGKYYFVQNLGQDRTYIYTLGNGLFGSANTGQFSPGPQPFAQTDAGYGPRHFAFHPNGRYMYSLNEVSSTLDVYLWSAENGSLTRVNSFSTLPEGYVNAQAQGQFTGAPELQGSTNAINTAGEIAVSQDGNYVYASNRTFDSIATFSVKKYGPDLDGVKPDWTWTRGETPRQFTLSPDGRYMYVGLQNGSSITVFKVDIDTGELKYLPDLTIGVQSPSCITFASCAIASCSAVGV
jgi:6-phosphogluconolactonase (cycloisomerase 2 family)